MKVLLFASAYNGLCQRAHRELLILGHTVSIELSPEWEIMGAAVDLFEPNLIICPFLKHRVPDFIWQEHPCLIVHPGIEGDRGPSSLDWSIVQDRDEWGVTLLQASEKMDAGDIWASQNFPMREVGKANLYRREVSRTAIELIHRALEYVNDQDFSPHPLDYNQSHVQGQWQDLMRQTQRTIDWQQDSTDVILRKLNAADSFPGVLDEIAGNRVYLYGARREPNYRGNPGELLGHNNGAVCRATKDGAIWIRQMKMAAKGDRPFFKLPALQVLITQMDNGHEFSELPSIASDVVQDIHYEVDNSVCYLTFDFYNGAMSTLQCLQLRDKLLEIKNRDDVAVIVLLGGEDFWSNGIHLNIIEAAPNPALESWHNINAINDVVLEILTTTDKLTVAALRSNAGAGGAMMPLACDHVVIRDGVVLNPHYKTMGLFGSEYWTYSLTKRVGKQRALEITEGCMPLVAEEAIHLRLADEMLSEDWDQYHRELREYCEDLARAHSFQQMVEQKALQREQDEHNNPLQQYRNEELRVMRDNFYSDQSGYHLARRNFVYKLSCGQTPSRLVLHRASESEELMVA